MIGVMALGACDGAIPAEGWRTVREEPVELTLVRQAVRGDRAAFGATVGQALELLVGRQDHRPFPEA